MNVRTHCIHWKFYKVKKNVWT